MQDSASLLHAVACGDAGAFWELWDAHAPMVRRVCTGFFGSRRDQAEDAFSTAMLRAWNQLPDRAAGIADPGAWIRTVTRNVCLDLHRSERREVPVGASLEASGSSDRDADEASVRSLLERIDALPEPLRDVLRDRAISGLSIRDIAEARCLTPSVVRERLTTARKVLRDRPGGASASPSRAAPQSAAKRLDRLGRAARQTRVIQAPTAAGGTRQMYVFVDSATARRAVRIETLSRMVDARPRSWRSRLELAHLLFAHGDLARAEAEFGKVIERNPLELDAHVRRAEALRMLGRTDEAALCAAQGAANFSSEATRSHLVAMSCLAHGDVEDCVALLRRANELAPEDLRHLRALAQVYHDLGRFVEAAEVFDRILAADPDDMFALVKSHDALLSTGRYEDNYRRMDRALRLDPDNVQVLRMVGGRPQPDREGVRRTYRRSMALLRRAVRLAPDCSDVWDAIARLYERCGRPEAGVAALRAFVRQFPGHSDGWSDLAEALRRAGRYAEAVEAVRRALDLAPDSALVLGRAVHVYGQAGLAHSLGPVLEALKASAPQHWGTWAVLARAHARYLDRADEALRLARQCTNLAPALSSARLTHADIALVVGAPREALREAGAAYRLLAPDHVPQGAETARILARAYRALGLDSRAERWYRCCADLARSLVRWYPIGARVLLAEALEASGRADEALQVCREALDLWPDACERDLLEGIARRIRAGGVR